jgi:hypothetical protein
VEGTFNLKSLDKLNLNLYIVDHSKQNQKSLNSWETSKKKNLRHKAKSNRLNMKIPVKDPKQRMVQLNNSQD